MAVPLVAAAGAAAADRTGNLLDSFIQSLFNAQAASKAWDKQKDWATRSPTYARIGLESAGFNPILALGSGGLQTSAKAPQAQGVSMSRSKSVSDLLLQQQQIDALDYQKALMRQQAMESHAREVFQDTQNKALELDLPRKEALADAWATNGKNYAQDVIMAETTANNWVGQLMREVRGFFDDLERNPDVSIQELVDMIQSSPLPVGVQQQMLDALEREEKTNRSAPGRLRNRVQTIFQRILDAYLAR